MEFIYVTKNDNKVIKIKLSESVEITGLKMLRLMRRHKDLNKTHWACIAAIVAGANKYSAIDYGALRLICGVQGIKPLEEASHWHTMLKYGLLEQDAFGILDQDVVMQRSKWSIKVRN